MNTTEKKEVVVKGMVKSFVMGIFVLVPILVVVGMIRFFKSVFLAVNVLLMSPINFLMSKVEGDSDVLSDLKTLIEDLK